MTKPMRFRLERTTDVTGASGTGHVADGVVWPDGAVTVRWRGEHKSTVNWDRLEDAEAVHGHGGATRIVWEADDDATLPDEVREAIGGNPVLAADAWPQVSGYVADMVSEGSEDAAQVLAFMHELKPGTRIFTGSVDQLRGRSA